MTVIRPADATETAAAWKVALKHKGGPVALSLSRQKLPVIDRAQYPAADNLSRGAYVLAEANAGQPRLILIATGSEVSLALEARAKLEEQGVPTRVVSMPSWELFEAQPREYKELVLPPAVTARLAIEAGVAQGWCRYVGDHGDVLSVERFGASAPGKVVLKEYGFTVENVVARALRMVNRV
jgi:transketolase